jgi:hypothetical protein
VMAKARRTRLLPWLLHLLEPLCPLKSQIRVTLLSF